MAYLLDDNVMRAGEKIGYIENNRLFDLGTRLVGYYEGSRIYDENDKLKGYVENNQVHWADTSFYDEVEKVRQHVSSGNYSEMPCAAVCLLFGWD